MPPKAGPSKKVVDKASAKIVEDKTFGLKNKNKSKKASAGLGGWGSGGGGGCCCTHRPTAVNETRQAASRACSATRVRPACTSVTVSGQG